METKFFLKLLSYSLKFLIDSDMNWKKLLKSIGIVLLIAIVLAIVVLGRLYPWVFAIFAGLCFVCVVIQYIYDNL